MSESAFTLTRALKEAAKEAGFEAVGATPIVASDHRAFYRWWLERGYHGTMDYLARDDAVAARVDPRTRWPELRSALVVAHHYFPDDPDAHGNEGTPPHRGIIARYARGRDYHRVMKKKLLGLVRWLEEETGRPLPVARAYVDTGPVLERDLARRAGLGWQGKNTMLIDPKRGSWFFIGSLLLPFELTYDEPFEADRCGSCTACLDACPTGALLGRNEDGAPVLDATRCISYLTIENRGPIPEALRPGIGNRVYGCDICQEVCPWNSPRLVPINAEADYVPRPPVEVDVRSPSALRASASPRSGHSSSRFEDAADSSRAAEAWSAPQPSNHLPGTESPSLVELMRMTREEWDVWTRGSAIRRAGYAGFKRNVAVALGNWSATEVAEGNWLASVEEAPEVAVLRDALAVLSDALENDEPLVREHAAWALGQGGLDRA